MHVPGEKQKVLFSFTDPLTVLRPGLQFFGLVVSNTSLGRTRAHEPLIFIVRWNNRGGGEGVYRREGTEDQGRRDWRPPGICGS